MRSSDASHFSREIGPGHVVGAGAGQILDDVPGLVDFSVQSKVAGSSISWTPIEQRRMPPLTGVASAAAGLDQMLAQDPARHRIGRGRAHTQERHGSEEVAAVALALAQLLLGEPTSGWIRLLRSTWPSSLCSDLRPGPVLPDDHQPGGAGLDDTKVILARAPSRARGRH